MLIKQRVSLAKSLNDFKTAETATQSFEERFRDFDFFLSDLYDLGHYQYRRESVSGSEPHIEIQDHYSNNRKKMINLASNDYLNLAKHPKVVDAGVKALRKYGAGAGSVPLLAGTLSIHKELEKRVATYKQAEDAIIFPSGFVSNYGFLSTILQANDVAILDMYAHASLFEGCIACNKMLFRHNDMKSLQTALEKCEKEYVNKVICIDGVYSMDGDLAPLPDIVELARKYGAYVLIDEAHASGVIGQNGRGTPEHFGMEGEIDFIAGTFSKALGSVGGFIASNSNVIRYLNFLCRPFMFSTAPAPSTSASIIEAINVAESDAALRDSLWSNINYFKERLLSAAYDIGNSETAIFPVIIGNDYVVKEICKILHENDVYANPVFYPAVKRRLSRIRFSVTSSLSKDDLDKAIDVLNYAYKTTGSSIS